MTWFLQKPNILAAANLKAILIYPSDFDIHQGKLVFPEINIWNNIKFRHHIFNQISKSGLSDIYYICINIDIPCK